MKNLLAFFIITFSILSIAQRPKSDSYQTESGDLIIQPVLHGTLVMEWMNQTIYIDPYGGSKAFQGLNSPNLILITDIHGDHMNQVTLDELNAKNAKLIVPQAVAEKLPQVYHKNMIILANNGETNLSGINIRAIPMYNLREEAKSFHTKGRGNGYILNFGNTRVYISGDTEDIQEMRNLKDIDIAFICMNLPYTMTVDKAASAVLDFKPKVVYPYHYRGKPDWGDTKFFKELINKSSSKIEVKLRNWYPEYD